MKRLSEKEVERHFQRMVRQDREPAWHGVAFAFALFAVLIALGAIAMTGQRPEAAPATQDEFLEGEG